MLNSTPPPDIEAITLEDQPLILSETEIEAKVALTLVNKTFNEYEARRSNNADMRWRGHDIFYTATVPTRNWEGTNTPRSSIGVPITFDQVEAAHSKILQVLFESDEEWFETISGEHDTSGFAKSLGSHIRYCFEQEEISGASNFETQLSLAIKEVLMYGNGGLLLQYNPQTRRPVPEFVTIKDIYVDTGLTFPSLQKSRSVIIRKLMTVDELDSLRDSENLKIPSRAVLTNLSENTAHSIGDTSKAFTSSISGFNSTNQSIADAVNPADKRIEVLIYYSKARIIWVLNQRVVAYNEKNPYGIIPLFYAPCYTVPSQFYGKSMIDINESNQAVIQALVNAYLDNKALSLFPPRVQKNSGLTTPSQQKWRPGAVFKADDAKDIAVLQPTADPSVFQDIAFFQNEAEKRSGVSSLMGGIPRPSNANRTFSGMQAQLGGSDLRLYPIIKNIENYIIIPLLYGIVGMLRFHTNEKDELHVIPGQAPIDGASLKKPISFKMHAASKMVTRDQLKQAFPFLAQYMLSGPFMSQIQREGKTVDFNVFTDMLQIAAGTKQRFTLIRPQTPQELSLMQQEQAAAQQAQQAGNQTKLQIAQMGSQTQITTAQIAAQTKQHLAQDPSEIAAKQVEQQLKQQKSSAKMEIMREKAANDARVAELKLQFEAARQQLAIKAQNDKIQMEGISSQQKLIHDAQQTKLKLAGEISKNQIQNAQGTQMLAHTQKTNDQKLDHEQKINTEKIRLTKESFSNKVRKKAEVKHKGN